MPLADLDDLVFGGWDVYPDDAYVAASRAGVLDKHMLEQLGDELRAIQPMPAVFEQSYVRNLHGDNVKSGGSKMDQAEALISDIQRFSDEHGCDRLVAVWCGSTEVYREPTAVHMSLEAFEQGLRDSHPDIAPSPDLRLRLPQAGHPDGQRRPEPQPRHPGDARAGPPERRPDHRQGLQDRPDPDEDDPRARASRPGCSGSNGWYSTNILGNRDGEVLDDPESFKSKEVSKLGVLDTIFAARDAIPSSTATSTTSCGSTTTRPAATTRRGGTTSTSSGGSATRCRSRSTSSAATRSSPPRSCSTWPCSSTSSKRAGLSGIQEWLSLLLEEPQPHPDGVYPEHDLFIQLMKLKNTLRHLQGDELITHLGAEYYD